MIVFLKKHWFWLVAAIVVVGGIGAVSYVRRDKKPTYDTAVVHRADLVEEVSVTGLVKPVDEVNLGFEASGKIVAVNADVGASVVPGQVIASLDSSELLAQLSSARATAASAESVLKEYQTSLQAEQARLDEIKSGTRPEEIQIAQIEVDNAQRALADATSRQQAVESKAAQDLENLYAGVGDIIRDGYTKADDAAHKYTDEMFSRDFVNRNELVFVVSDASAKSDAESARGDAFNAVDALASSIINLPTDQKALDSVMTSTLSRLSTVQNFLLKLNRALNVSVGVPLTTLNTYKANVSTARANINAAISDINGRIQAIGAQKATNTQNTVNAKNEVSQANNAYLLAQSQLSLKQAGSVPEQIRAQEAKVAQTQLMLNSQSARVRQTYADVQRISAQLANYVIVAPLKGIVTKQDAKVGEIVSASKVLTTVISQAAFEITANVPEADIAKLHIGDQASLTLDAYGDEILFDATVVLIDPAQTIVEGVTTYKVTFQFTKEDERIKSGMTANLIVATGRRQQVLAVAQRAIALKNGHRYAQVLNGDQVSEVEVKTGLISADGLIEIIEGLSEGQLVVTSTRKD